MHKTFHVLLVFASTCIASGQGYVGADAALKSLSPTASTKKRPSDPLAGLRKSIRAFRSASAHMTPKESASAWIALSDRCAGSSAIWALEDGSFETSIFPDVMGVLPAPETWPEIVAQLTRRLSSPKGSPRDRANLAMFHTLLGHWGDSTKDLMLLPHLNIEQMAIRAQIGVELALLDGKADRILPAYHDLAVALSRPTQPIGGDKKIDLPDLTGLLGAERTKTLVRDLLHSFDGELVASGGPAFKRFLQEMVLSSAGSLKHPQWWLAIDPDGGPLFEAIVKQFPNVSSGIRDNSDWNSNTFGAAASRYVIYLVANDRIDDATSFFKSQERSSWFTDQALDDETELLKKRGKVESYISFLEKIIGGESITRPIDAYKNFCESVGQAKRAEEFLARLPASMKEPVRDPTDQTVRDLIAANKVAEAGSYLAGILRRQMGTKSTESSYPNTPSMLVDIGRYLKRRDFVELGIEAGIKALRESDFGFTTTWVCDVLAEEGRAGEAERLLAEVLQARTHGPGFSSPPAGGDELRALVRLYARSERYDDVLTMLRDAPNWGSADLAFVDLNTEGPNSILFIAAQALVAVGRRQEALHVLEYLVQVQPQLDDAYALMIDADRSFAGKFIDEKQGQRPMDSRPLMWRAEILRRDGKLGEAESCVKKAIALDPQDTAGIRNHTRFQAWAILAAITRQEGRLEEAAKYQRHFDSPQKLFYDNQVSLESQIDPAAVMRRALVDNPDDFVCRFNLADQLETQGNHADAEAQLIEACRTAASQLGTAGEAILSSQLPLCIKLLEAELAKDPSRAFTYTLLGNAYTQAKEFDRATASFRRAIQLDPDNFSAWNGLQALAANRPNDPDLGDRIALNLARLAPFAVADGVGTARDFSRLWSTAHAVLHESGPVDEPIFALPASAATMQANDDVNVENARRWRRPPSPGTVISKQSVIHQFMRLSATLSAKGAK